MIPSLVFFELSPSIVQPPKNGYGESNAIAYLPPDRGVSARAAKPVSAAPATSAAPPKMASAPWNKKG